MKATSIPPFLLVAPASALPARDGVWGTGGRLPPENREALDWLTLARMLGWGVDMAAPDAHSIAPQRKAGRHWIVLGCAPEHASPDVVDLLRGWLSDEPIVVVGRAGSSALPWSELAGVSTNGDVATGQNLQWVSGPRRTYLCRKPFEALRVKALEGVDALADMDGLPVVCARRVGRGRVVTLAFHPGKVRDDNGAATALLRDTMIGASLRAVAWIDHSGTVALRMDDPGSAQNVHLRSWRYRQLGAGEWAEIGADLEARRARLSVAYCGGWVDDGDAARGILEVGGAAVPRVPGAVHPSPDVVYRPLDDPDPGALHDYAGQYRALLDRRREGVVDIELHGHTHMDPDRERWARSADRYDNVAWFRELGERARPRLERLSDDAHPLALGMAVIERWFGGRPSTLICPGDEWTNDALGVALRLGLRAVSSYYFALRHDDRFCWTHHVCAPYLDTAESRWFDSGLPVVGYFHDRDPALHGPQWIRECLDAWARCGATRFVTLRELATASGLRLAASESADACELAVEGVPADGVGMTLPVRVVLPGSRVPSRVDLGMGSARPSTRLKTNADGVVQIPLTLCGEGT